MFVCSGDTVHVLMRDEKEGRKEASKVKQTTRQSNTAHPRQSLFLRKMSYVPRVGLKLTTLYALNRALYH